MAIDTKPNLSSSKFEQCVGDILALSGCTEVHGTFEISSGATLSILPNHGLNKVLTSDASGNATWQTPQSSSVSGATGNLPMFNAEGNGLVDSGINAYLIYAGL